jgi:Ion channel
MLRRLEFALGLLVWLGVIWDGFATIVLPRTVAPMRRLSGRFNRWSWRLWAAVGRRVAPTGLRLSVLAVYGPISVILLLVIWAGLIILAFAMIYHGLGPRFQAASGPAGFGTLLYSSALTFLTLGLGDITYSDPIGRLFIILETGTGYLFLGLIITYMPALEQAYAAREVHNLLIHSRAGRPPEAVKLLHRYASPDRMELLRGNLREAERWMAEILQSHLSHPVLSFYRAQHWGHSWLVSLTITLDSCALLIATGEGIAAEQAKLTYRMGLQLLRDLTDALGLVADPQRPGRLTEAGMPALVAALEASAIPWTIGLREAVQLIRLVRRYEVYLMLLSEWLVIPLPDWVPAEDGESEADDADAVERPDESP